MATTPTASPSLPAPAANASIGEPSTGIDPVIASAVSGGVRRYPGDTGPQPANANGQNNGLPFGSGPGSSSPLDANGNFLNTPEGARANARAQVQDKLDAINNSYAGIMQQVQQNNANSAGKVRSTAARSGELGSDFGNTDIANNAKDNEDVVNKYVAAKDAAIADVIDKANAHGDDMYNAQQTLSKANQTQKDAFVKDSQTKAAGFWTDSFKQGASISDFSDQEYKKMLDQTGWSPEQAAVMATLNQPKSNVLHEYVDGNKYYTILKDPVTGKITSQSVDLGFTVPSGFTMTKDTNGNLVFTPKNGIDPNKPLASQIHVYNPGAKDNRTTQQKNDQNNALVWMRSQADYKPEYETMFKNDPIAQAKVIEAWKAAQTASKKTPKTPTGGSNPFSGSAK